MTLGIIPKMIRIFRCAAEQKSPWRLQLLYSKLDIPRSTVHRLCKTLTKHGIFTYDPRTQEYYWGPEMTHVAQSMYQRTEFFRTALPVLRKIVDQCNESAILAIYDRLTHQIFFADQVQSNQPICHVIKKMGVNVPIHAGASGKAILAYLPGEKIEEILSLGLEPLTDQTVCDPDQLRCQLFEIRRKGYAISHGEREPETVGIASPIFNSSSNVIGSLVVSIPSYRFHPKMENDIRLLIQEGAKELSCLMGLEADSYAEIMGEKASLPSTAASPGGKQRVKKESVFPKRNKITKKETQR